MSVGSRVSDLFEVSENQKTERDVESGGRVRVYGPGGEGF